MLVVRPRRVLIVFLVFEIVLLGLHFAARGLALLPPEPRPQIFVNVFDLDNEDGLGTWFACFQLVLAALCWWWAGSRDSGPRWPWRLAALVFVFLSIDEAVQLHEVIGLFIHRVLTSADFGTSALPWTALYAPAALVFAALMIPLIVRLPADTRRGIITAGGTYLVGAVGFELVAEMRVAVRSWLEHAVWLGLEETGEALGVTVLIWALLRHMALHQSGPLTANLVVGSPERAEEPEEASVL